MATRKPLVLVAGQVRELPAADTFDMPAEQMFEARDEQSSGTDPQYGSSSTWLQRTLNTVGRNTITGASLSASTITLPAGTYHVAARAPGPFNVTAQQGRHKARLATSASIELVPGSSAGVNGDSWVIGVFVLASTTQVVLQHRTSDAYRLGSPSSFSVPEVYSEITIRKIA